MIVHTYPVADVIEHDTDGDDCICGPTAEAVFRDDGSNGWQIIHHSLDGREVARMTPDLYLCWCPRAIEDHHNGECPTRTEWLEIEDSELDLG